MAYTILRFKKDKGGAIAGCERHNERKKEAYKSNPDIDMNKSKENYHIIHAPQYTYSRKIKELIKEYGCKTRKDSVKLVETLITASPEFMNRLSKGEQREYFERAVKFMKDEIGEDRIISAVVHMDEATPHMHLVFCPINKDGKLSALADICIQVPETETYMVQELHLPVYHCLCLMLEEKFFG